MTTPNRPPLSPVAQAVMMAATNGNINVVNDPVYRQCIAAALRALVKEVRTHPMLSRYYIPQIQRFEKDLMEQILAIAAELESANN